MRLLFRLNKLLAGVGGRGGWIEQIPAGRLTLNSSPGHKAPPTIVRMLRSSRLAAALFRLHKSCNTTLSKQVSHGRQRGWGRLNTPSNSSPS